MKQETIELVYSDHEDMRVEMDDMHAENERLRADMTRIAEMDPTIDGAARYMVAIATAALGQKEAADEDWGCAPLTSGEEAAEQEARRREMMSDLECIEYAIQLVLLKCRQRDPSHLSIPASGETVMEWFAQALQEARSVRKAAQKEAADERS